MTPEREQRHQQEVEFFDAAAHKARSTLTPLDELVLLRYRGARVNSARFPLEYAIALALGIQGKRILDVGCGDGANAVLLASLGADVTGFDISPESIAIARERAKLCQVEERCRFVVAAVEDFDGERDPFDVVWCDALLHHVIPVLDQVLGRLRRFQAAHGRTILMEPVSHSALLRGIRTLVPVSAEATPGERPLRDAEVAMIQQVYPNLRTKYFRNLGRLDRIVLRGTNLERASMFRRATIRTLAEADRVLNGTPLSRFASIAVMHSDD
jgi:ubiquinone/menaquinone biosynthesis C-methylase UbiE